MASPDFLGLCQRTDSPNHCCPPEIAMPIAAGNQNSEELKRKREAVTKAATELHRNVERADQCYQEFAEMMQTCINYLTEYRSWWLQQLQTEKDELLTAVESAVQETAVCVDQGLEPVSALGKAVWRGELPQLFTYSLQAPDLLALCGSWAHYSLQGLEEALHRGQEGNHKRRPSTDVPHFFAAVVLSSVELYDLNTQQTSKHWLPVDFGSGGSYVPLDRYTLLCLGGSSPTSAVYELDLPCLQLTSLTPLLHPRSYAGVAKTSLCVYAFGGDCGDNKSCEKYALQDRQWLPLSNMNYGRNGFTPSLFRGQIYLPCPPILVIESFSPETEVFTALPVTLPPQMKQGLSVSFVLGGELCVLTRGKQLGRWKVESEAEFRLFDTDRQCWSTQPPLVVDSLLLIANDGKVEKFSLDYYTFI